MVRVGAVVLLGCSALVSLVRLLGLDRGSRLALLVAFLPYWFVVSTVGLGLLLVERAWRLALPALALVVLQLTWLLPRFVPDAAAGAAELRVCAANSHAGQLDPAALVSLARTVDVLAVSERRDRWLAAVARAGLGEVLPYSVVPPGADTALFSRYPLVGGTLDLPTTYPLAAGTVDVSGRPLRLVAVRAFYPAGNPDRWTRDLDALRAAAGPDTVLLGDFNATLDHTPLRRLLAAGLTDAEAARGNPSPTWPADRPYPPVLTLDHVLHGPSLSTTSVWTRTLPGTDHRAICAALALVTSPRPRA